MNLKLIYVPKGRAREYSEYALDIYDGCNLACKYCFNDPSKEVKIRKGFSLEKLENDCEKLSKSEDKNFKVLLSFSSDPYNKMAVETELTRKCLEVLNKYNINFRVLTKNPLDACRDFDLYKDGDEFGITLGFINDDTMREWEPYANSVEDRLDGLRVAKAYGIYTWISMEPVINNDEALKVIEYTKGFVDKYKVGKINHNEEVEKGINWKEFGLEVESILKGLKEKGICDYYIKKDLRAKMEE